MNTEQQAWEAQIEKILIEELGDNIIHSFLKEVATMIAALSTPSISQEELTIESAKKFLEANMENTEEEVIGGFYLKEIAKVMVMFARKYSAPVRANNYYAVCTCPILKDTCPIHGKPHTGTLTTSSTEMFSDEGKDSGVEQGEAFKKIPEVVHCRCPQCEYDFDVSLGHLRLLFKDLQSRIASLEAVKEKDKARIKQLEDAYAGQSRYVGQLSERIKELEGEQKWISVDTLPEQGSEVYFTVWRGEHCMVYDGFFALFRQNDKSKDFFAFKSYKFGGRFLVNDVREWQYKPDMPTPPSLSPKDSKTDEK